MRSLALLLLAAPLLAGGEECVRAAVAELAKGQYGNAIEFATRAIDDEKNEPWYAEAFWVRGRAKVELGRWNEALKDLGVAIGLDGEMAQAYIDRARVFVRLGRFEEAKRDLKEALRLQPSHPEALAVQGELSLATDDPEKALEEFDAAVAADPKNPDAYLGRGKAKSRLEDFEGARKDFDKACGLAPRAPAPYEGRGSFLYERGTLDAAVADFRTAIRNDEGGYGYLRVRIWAIRIRTEKYEATKTELEHVVRVAREETVYVRVAKYILGVTDEGEFWGSIRDEEGAYQQKESLTVMSWFAGVKNMVEGKKQIADAYFARATSTRRVDLAEYRFAMADRERLKQ